MIKSIGYINNLTMEEKNKWFGFFIALPALIAIFSTIFYPLLIGIINSFLDLKLTNLKDNTLNWNGLNNYIKLFNDRYFWNALKNTVFFTTTWTFGQLLLVLLRRFCLTKKLR